MSLYYSGNNGQQSKENAKKAKDVNDADVQSKKAAAEEYCKYATEYNSRHGGKPWKYVLLPHDSVERSHSFMFVIHLGRI